MNISTSTLEEEVQGCDIRRVESVVLMQIANPLFAKYKLACTFPNCAGKSIIEQATSAGLRIGELVPEDQANPSFARCPKCRRCLMKVMEGPPAPEPKGPVGFSRIPTE